MSQSVALKNVLLVDDDDSTIEIMKSYLEKAGYTVNTARQATDAFDLIKTHLDSLSAIVSDVNMPSMNGYEFCRTFRDTWPDINVPFIFVSANTNLEEKLEGFAAGGDDYITKPVEYQELQVKLDHIINKRNNVMQLNQKLVDSQQAAFQAMSYTSQLGQILQFVQNSVKANSLEALANYVFQVTNSFSLNCALQFRLGGQINDYASSGEMTPLESNVIALACQKGRIYDFNSRTLFNHDTFSLLVKNMPVDNRERYGILKDTLCNLCNAIESRTQFLLANDQTKLKDKQLNVAKQSVAAVEASLKEIQHENLRAIETMVDDMEEAMLSLGLTENQENQMRDICKECIEKTDQIFLKSDTIYDELAKVLELLKR